MKKLAEVGDSFAKRLFKEEISGRFLTGITNVQEFLIEGNYFDNFAPDELNCIIDDLDRILRHKYRDIFSHIHISAWYNLAMILLNKGDIRRSSIIYIFSHIHISAWYNLAMILLNKGDIRL